MNWTSQRPKGHIRMVAEDPGTIAEESVTLSLPGRVIVSVTVPGWSTHVRLSISPDGHVSIQAMDRVPVTPSSTRGLMREAP